MFSRLIRRSHMYLALFLTPWVLMYTLSTMVMNHRALFLQLYGEPLVKYEALETRPYDGIFPQSATPEQMAIQILSDLDLNGAFSARRGEQGSVVIVRQHPARTRRITYQPASRQLLLEREVFRAPAFLERMHRRRGYQHNFLMDDLWAASVDAFIVAMVFWVFSGLWLWWQMRATRRWGGVCALSGVALFTTLVFTM